MLVNVNRAMAAPWTMFCDQSDIVSQRDTGWLHVYCEENQEVLDSIIQGFKVAEQILLPVMINMDGLSSDEAASLLVHLYRQRFA